MPMCHCPLRSFFLVPVAGTVCVCVCVCLHVLFGHLTNPLLAPSETQFPQSFPNLDLVVGESVQVQFVKHV